MTFQTFTGIIIRTYPYSDTSWITKLYTENEGIVGVFVSKSAAKGVGNTPFNLVEIVASPTKGALSRCKEMKLLHGFLGLRNQLKTLQAAGEMLNAVLSSQEEGHANPILYALLYDYLLRLEKGGPADKLYMSFILKLMRIEGVWSDENPGGFSENEWKICLALAYCKSEAELVEVYVKEGLLEKIARLFRDSTT